MVFTPHHRNCPQYSAKEEIALLEAYAVSLWDMLRDEPCYEEHVGRWRKRQVAEVCGAELVAKIEKYPTIEAEECPKCGGRWYFDRPDASECTMCGWEKK